MLHRSTPLVLCALGVASALVLVVPAAAQVHYHDSGHPWKQRASEGPDAEVPGWYYNLGITGMRAELVADAPKSLVIRHVFAGSPASSMVLVGDTLLVTEQSGQTTLLAASKEYKVLGKNSLNEHTDASPAIANGRVYIRTYKHLWCIGEKSPE